MQCVHVHRENEQRCSYTGPFDTEVWIEYICIMYFHTLLSLEILYCIMSDVLDDEVVGLNKKKTRRNACEMQKSVDNVMSRLSKRLL